MIRQQFRYDLLFLIIVLVQFLAYNYFTLIDDLPYSVHMWRQADCLSFALNYYENGMDPLRPQVHHVLGGEGLTAAEFPGLYYLVAGAYHIFGPHEWVYRSIWMLILFTGLFCFYRTLLLYLKDAFWSIVLPALVFCSPVLAFYGNSFVIDPAALAFTMMAWYFFARHCYEGRWRYLVYSSVLFLLSGLFKEPSLITYVALCGLAVIRWLNEWKRTGQRPVIPFYKILIFMLPVAGVLCWFFIKKHYNEIHSNVAFLAEIRPIWDIDPEKVREITDHILKNWIEDYFNQLTLLLTGILFVTNMILFRRNWLLNLFVLTVFLGAVSFVLLFYWQFRNHDYYIINILLIIPLTWLAFVRNMEKWTMGNHRPAMIIKGIFLLILMLNIFYAGHKMDKRMDAKWAWVIPDEGRLQHLKEADQYLTSLGVSRDDKIVSIPDVTMNLTLYLLNRPGWTNVYESNYTTEDILRHAERGAKYLVVNDSAELSKPYLQQLKQYEIGRYEEITVFRLP